MTNTAASSSSLDKNKLSKQNDTPTKVALFISAFYDELISLGVRDIVVSPGSRSTPLAMVAFVGKFNIHVDIDERGAAFFALGLAKASGRPVCVVCTSGTAVANYLPAALEAQGSRVPIILLTADRPPHMQNLGAPQTCDQIKIFGDYVRMFQQMPLPGSDEHEIAFARQMALEAFAAAAGSEASLGKSGEPWYGCISNAGPVHLNFPFDEPLMPNLETDDLFSIGRRISASGTDTPPYPLVPAKSYPKPATIAQIQAFVKDRNILILCGEGSFVNSSEAERLLALAHMCNIPLLADPLSNLRSYDVPLVIDNFDNIFRRDDLPAPELIIRFGRYPISKACTTALAKCKPIQIVVDAAETRDFSSATDVFVRCTPAAFVKTWLQVVDDGAAPTINLPAQQDFAKKWTFLNEQANAQILQVTHLDGGFEGVYVHKLFELIPKAACLFSASSLSIRMVDSFYLKQNKELTILCNRALNGIDGSLSAALGASLCFEHTTFLVGDLALLHDINALALQRELLCEQSGGARDKQAPNVIIVLMNNQGGGIFEMLPQKSKEPYFERLFSTPQDVDFSHVARGFGIPHAKVATVKDFESGYLGFLGKPGIHLLEISVPSAELSERYGKFLT